MLSDPNYELTDEDIQEGLSEAIQYGAPTTFYPWSEEMLVVFKRVAEAGTSTEADYQELRRLADKAQFEADVEDAEQDS